MNKCVNQACMNPKLEKSNYCSRHTCMFYSKCVNEVRYSTNPEIRYNTCHDHKCRHDGCDEDCSCCGLYCNTHRCHYGHCGNPISEPTNFCLGHADKCNKQDKDRCWVFHEEFNCVDWFTSQHN